MTKQTTDSWHSHVYFDADSKAAAEALVATIKGAFPPEEYDVTYGRWHDKPVGPHPDGSTQLAYPHALFADIMALLAVHQNGLVIFTHPNTGTSNEAQLADHRDHAIWMGAVRPLRLSVFGAPDQV
ncbi:DOPA 4,5-dioxygenase family protein [Alphaproteobacteria bacterium]|nr:DOPA 4,5-dioxygenase family protein [Alphaproteobacteria bacterium]